MIPGAEKVKEQDFTGLWRDDKKRLVQIIEFKEDFGWRGYFKDDPEQKNPQTYTKYFGVNAEDGSRLMERKRGEEKGWD